MADSADRRVLAIAPRARHFVLPLLTLSVLLVAAVALGAPQAGTLVSVNGGRTFTRVSSTTVPTNTSAAASMPGGTHMVAALAGDRAGRVPIRGRAVDPVGLMGDHGPRLPADEERD